jgi:hypothetical protein
MSEIKDGGPAFPCEIPLTPNERAAGSQPPFEVGLSMRDYFAAKAMSALIASEGPDDESTEEYIDRTADSAYLYADAMLRARGQS